MSRSRIALAGALVVGLGGIFIVARRVLHDIDLAMKEVMGSNESCGAPEGGYAPQEP